MVCRHGLNLGGFLRRHDTVQAVQKAVADAQSDAVAYAVFRAPLRIHPGDIQRKPVRLRAAFQMATGTVQAVTGITRGIPVGLHHDVVTEHDIALVVIEHRARLQLLYRGTRECRKRTTEQDKGAKMREILSSCYELVQRLSAAGEPPPPEAPSAGYPCWARYFVMQA